MPQLLQMCLSLQVAYAALSSLADVIRVPACSRLFESYLERVLPLVFVRVIDSKDNIRQAAARVLNVRSFFHGGCSGSVLEVEASLWCSVDAQKPFSGPGNNGDYKTGSLP